tara:strand:+ start:2126 stop:3817 length:1692 start_codon:yes stop_codon:yes gene_type:complete
LIKNTFVFILLACSLFGQADHLLLSTIVIAPDSAEMVIIKNPTDSEINLNNYYLTDATASNQHYYNFVSGQNYWSGNAFDFFVKFPNISLSSGDSLVIGMSTSDVFYNYYGFNCDISLADSETLFEGDIGILIQINGMNAFEDTRESLILFHWDGNSSVVEDIDYFLWSESDYNFLEPSSHQLAIDKSLIDGYLPDTPVEQQVYKMKHESNYAFVRTNLEEVDEVSIGGNGLTGHNETSENMIESWDILFNPLFVFGCNDELACNYNSDATFNDGSCEYAQEYYDCDGNCLNDIDGDMVCDEIAQQTKTIQEIIYNCDDELGGQLECNGQYDLSNESVLACPLYEEIITTTGIIVDYFDITPFNGPYSFTLADEYGGQIDFVVWPESSSYQDGFDITLTELNKLTESPFGRYQVTITGTLGAYCDDDELLDISNEWQITVEYESDILISEEWINDNQKITLDVSPYPFVPSIGEKIKYSYSAPTNNRLVIRVFDLSGRFVTTLFDGIPTLIFSEYVTKYWDGRTHLGELVMPGTYIMHMESTGFSTGQSYTAMSPIVIGARLK